MRLGRGKAGPDSGIRIAPAGIATGSAETRRRWSVQQQGVDRVPVPQGGLPAQQLPGQGGRVAEPPHGGHHQGADSRGEFQVGGERGPVEARDLVCVQAEGGGLDGQVGDRLAQVVRVPSGSPPVWAPTTSAAACRPSPGRPRRG